ncbi:MAG TPA: prepilin-type N-terminal cleavage/methylation domain-containing protein, partial [Phycisphaerae bacterium]|nr:prepilin-type N-terminal cleavage/methylation domain-containing protein [Phycisphaerae bacterium]
VRRCCSGWPAFTLIELMVVIAIISLLVAMIFPSLSRARELARTTICATRQRNLAIGFTMYHAEYDGVMLPGRFGSSSSTNQYWVGNGWKYRPRWVAAMGAKTGAYPFDNPSPVKAGGGDRQDYEREVFICPTAPDWVDERNYAYGYNYQFLGNARNHPSGSGWRNFPVKVESLRTPAGTVVAADAMGTAAEYPTDQRLPYTNDGQDKQSWGNHGWSLDPPRLTSVSDRGPGDGPADPRTGVHCRHLGKANASFCDGHAEGLAPHDLGYDVLPDGRFTDNGRNLLFSGSGDNIDPPVVW